VLCARRREGSPREASHDPPDVACEPLLLPEPSCVEPELDELPELELVVPLELELVPLELEAADVVVPEVDARATPATVIEAATLPTASAERTTTVRRRPASLESIDGVSMTPPCPPPVWRWWERAMP
jgi:hypothetical protein